MFYWFFSWQWYLLSHSCMCMLRNISYTNPIWSHITLAMVKVPVFLGQFIGLGFLITDKFLQNLPMEFMYVRTHESRFFYRFFKRDDSWWRQEVGKINDDSGKQARIRVNWREEKKVTRENRPDEKIPEKLKTKRHVANSFCSRKK